MYLKQGLKEVILFCGEEKHYKLNYGVLFPKPLAVCWGYLLCVSGLI